MAFMNRARNLFRRATVIIYFQRHPGKLNSAGIEGLKFVVKVDGKEVQTGTTDSRGRAALHFDRTKTADLKIMGMTYEIDVRTTLEGEHTARGVHRRLNMLGYNVGKVDGIFNKVSCDRAVLNFQADTAGLKMDGIGGVKPRRKIKSAIGE